MNRTIDNLLTKDVIPDFLIRQNIRKLLRQRLIDETKPNQELQQQHLMRIVDELKNSPIAIETKAANEQHYELPTAFFQLVMGKHMKYSSCYWNASTPNLSAAENLALEKTCAHAELENGMKILELGCGWGSLTMFMAAKFPDAQITGVSNSATQKQYIDKTCAERGLKNVRIITADMNVFSLDEQFDRVVSVEMFEHMRNYELLMEKIAGMLTAEGKLFVHIFTHQSFTYYFDDLKIQQHFHWDGTHYEKTANCWLENMDKNRQTIMPILSDTYGAQQATKWWVYWRIFFMACAELWGYNKGREWFVSHYLFVKA